MSLLGRFFGYVRDDPDPRDHRFLLSHPQASEVALPASVDLRGALPPVWHQESLGSCTAHSAGALLAYLYPGFIPSRLQLYYAARAIEGTADKDNGVQIRNAMKAMLKVGVLAEDAWPYDVERFAQQPPDGGERHTIAAYSRLASETEMLSCLALSMPFVLAIQLPSYFEGDVARTGVMPLPSGRPEMIGAHAMLCVGYDLDFRSNPILAEVGVEAALVDSTALLVRNSWGSWWGRDGHVYVPMSWATNPSTGGDCWTGHKLFTTSSEPQGSTVAGVPIKGQFQS